MEQTIGTKNELTEQKQIEQKRTGQEIGQTIYKQKRTFTKNGTKT